MKTFRKLAATPIANDVHFNRYGPFPKYLIPPMNLLSVIDKIFLHPDPIYRGKRTQTLQILLCLMALCIATPKAQANPPSMTFEEFGSGTQFPLPTTTSVVLIIDLVHDAGTSITVNFSLTNIDGETIAITYGGTQTFTSFGTQVTSITLPSQQCISPASGWRIFGAAVGQQPQNFTTGSYLPNLTEPTVSIAQNPPDMEFLPTVSGSLMVISSQTNPNATTTQTNLTINDNLYLTAYPANIGCATSVGYQINVNVDGVSPPNGTLQDLGNDEYYAYQLPLSSGVLGAGSHTAVFTIISPTGATVATTRQNTFFLAAPATITTQPMNQTVNVGASATFSVVASGDPTPSFQWAFNGLPISGATGSSYTINNVNTNEAGNYSCTVNNYAGSATSSSATLQVVVPAVKPSIKSFSVSPAGIPKIIITGQPGSNEVVQSSSDLKHWTPITTNLNTSGTISVTLPASTNGANYYRVGQ